MDPGWGPVVAPPSTSSTSVVATVGPCYHHPQGARHQCLQLWWWPLPDLLPAPPRGSAIDVFNFGGGRYQACRQHPQGGSPSTSSTSVVATAGPIGSTPRGPAIDVFNFDGVRCRTCRKHPPRGSAIDVFNFDGGHYRTCRQHPQGAHIDVSNFQTSSFVTSWGPAINVS
jgi:hypothetical protein